MLRHYANIGMQSVLLVGALLLSSCGALVQQPVVVKGSGSTSITQPIPTPNSSSPLVQSPLTAPPVGWTASPVCTFSTTGLQVHPQNNQAYICLVPIQPLHDFSAKVTVRLLSGAPNHAFGIAFRHNDPKSYDFFGIDARGRFTLTVVVNDRATTLIPFSAQPAIISLAGSDNTLQVTMRGNQATMVVNGTAVGQAQLPDFPSGIIGLRGINDGVVAFRDLLITSA